MMKIWFQSINQRLKFIILLFIYLIFIPEITFADRNSDEDRSFYEITVKENFARFHKKNGRFPKTWIELGVQDSCSGFMIYEKKNFPKSTESITWKPRDCELSYKIIAAGKNYFKIIALKDEHVVSSNEKYKIMYFKTPYHDHGPYEGNGD
jgi:hypothetical protein